MIKTLQAIFPSCIFITDAKDIRTPEYQWFLTHDNDVIGIKQDELTEKDRALLNAFLTPYNTTFPTMTTAEQRWKSLFERESNNDPPLGSGHYRLVYFSYPVNGLEPIEFNEAIKAILPAPVSVLWENNHTGIIVEEGDEGLSYEQIVDVLMSDLYIKIRFFVGPYLLNRGIAGNYYKQLLHDAPIAFAYDKHPVVSYLDALPYVMIEQSGPDFLRNLPELILKDAANEPELLTTMETFMQHHLNVSVTAKELFLHRNSLQYRIDKFLEKTGIDIREFQGAMTVKLALLIKKQLD